MSSNESYLMFVAALWLAKRIDGVTNVLFARKENKNDNDDLPRVNLRWISSWSFLLALAVIVLIIGALF